MDKKNFSLDSSVDTNETDLENYHEKIGKIKIEMQNLKNNSDKEILSKDLEILKLKNELNHKKEKILKLKKSKIYTLIKDLQKKICSVEREFIFYKNNKSNFKKKKDNLGDKTKKSLLDSKLNKLNFNENLEELKKVIKCLKNTNIKKNMPISMENSDLVINKKKDLENHNNNFKNIKRNDEVKKNSLKFQLLTLEKEKNDFSQNLKINIDDEFNQKSRKVENVIFKNFELKISEMENIISFQKRQIFDYKQDEENYYNKIQILKKQLETSEYLKLDLICELDNYKSLLKLKENEFKEISNKYKLSKNKLDKQKLKKEERILKLESSTMKLEELKSQRDIIIRKNSALLKTKMTQEEKFYKLMKDSVKDLKKKEIEYNKLLIKIRNIEEKKDKISEKLKKKKKEIKKIETDCKKEIELLNKNHSEEISNLEEKIKKLEYELKKNTFSNSEKKNLSLEKLKIKEMNNFYEEPSLMIEENYDNELDLINFNTNNSENSFFGDNLKENKGLSIFQKNLENSFSFSENNKEQFLLQKSFESDKDGLVNEKILNLNVFKNEKNSEINFNLANSEVLTNLVNSDEIDLLKLDIKHLEENLSKDKLYFQMEKKNYENSIEKLNRLLVQMNVKYSNAIFIKQ